MQAAILSLHLEKLPSWTQRRQEIASTYRAGLTRHHVESVVGPTDVASSVWHHFVLRTQDRDRLRSFLGELGVATDIHYPYYIASVPPAVRALSPVHQKAAYPIALGLSEQVLSLPIGPWMTDAQVDHVAAALAGIPEDLLAS